MCEGFALQRIHHKEDMTVLITDYQYFNRRGDEVSWVASPEGVDEGGQPLERVYLVGVQQKGAKSKYGYSVEQSLEELGRLASTAGLEVNSCHHIILQNRGCYTLELEYYLVVCRPARWMRVGECRGCWNCA